MSCNLVTARDVHALVYARALAKKNHSFVCAEMTDDAFGAWLLRENARSLVTRYGTQGAEGAEDDKAYRYDPRLVAAISVVQCIKSIRYYACQTCGIRDWEESRVKFVCDTLLAGVIPSLPGYEEAAWGMS